jgi:hypothetical protein
MAGPSIAVRVIGDLSNFAKSMGDTATTGEGTAKRIQSAFSGMLGTLNQTGVLGPLGAAFDGIDQAIGKIIEHGKKIGPALMGAGGALAGVGTGLAAFGSGEQASHQQLQQAVEATGKSYDDFGDQVDQAVKHQEKYGDSAGQTEDALRQLTEATHDPQKALDLLGEASDVAAAKHEDLGTAATQLGRVYNGSNKVLKEFGVEAEKAGGNTKEMAKAQADATKADDNAAKAKQHLSDLQAQYAGKSKLTVSEQQNLQKAMKDVQSTTDTAAAAHQKLDGMQLKVVSSAQAGADNLAKLSDVVKGQASASADTFSGKLAEVKAKVEDAVSSFAQHWGPTIQTAGIAMAGLGAVIETVPAILGGLSAAWDAVAASEGLALGPILLIIVGIGLLVAGVILAYQHVGFFHDAVDKMWQILQAGYNWIKDNWPLLLAILTGPFGLAVLWIVNNWQSILDFFKGIPGAIGGFFSTLGGILAAPFTWAWGVIQRGWDDVVTFVAGLPARIGTAVTGMWDGITGAFKTALDAVIDMWNNLKIPSFSIGGWSTPFGDLPSWDTPEINFPDIPRLATGGIITQPTLALIGEAGPEAVVPLNQTRTGSVVHIETANFAGEADIDLLMRRTAWATRTAAV